jgi:hypothetical protein
MVRASLVYSKLKRSRISDAFTSRGFEKLSILGFVTISQKDGGTPTKSLFGLYLRLPKACLTASLKTSARFPTSTKSPLIIPPYSAVTRVLTLSAPPTPLDAIKTERLVPPKCKTATLFFITFASLCLS